MKVIIGADRMGFDLKEAIKEAMIQRGFEVTDATPDEPMLFQDAAKAVAGSVARGEFERGIALCGTGMGVSIIANKHRGVYAALCESLYQARRARVINNTNVLCMGGMIVGNAMGVDMTLAWLESEYLQDATSEKERERLSQQFDVLVEFESVAYADD